MSSSNYVHLENFLTFDTKKPGIVQYCLEHFVAVLQTTHAWCLWASNCSLVIISVPLTPSPSHILTAEPRFLVISWGTKPEVTSGQFGIWPLLQLLLIRPKQNKPEFCSYGPVQDLCGVRWDGEEGCGKVLFMHKQTCYVCAGGGGGGEVETKFLSHKNHNFWINNSNLKKSFKKFFERHHTLLFSGESRQE